MIDKAIEVRMAPAREMKLIELDDAPRGHGLHNAGAPVHPSRTGLLVEFQEFRTLVFTRFEDVDQQLQSIRNRLNALESHVFGDGPQAVRG